MLKLGIAFLNRWYLVSRKAYGAVVDVITNTVVDILKRVDVGDNTNFGAPIKLFYNLGHAEHINFE